MIDIAVIASVIEARVPLLERALVTWRSACQGLDAALCVYAEEVPLSSIMQIEHIAFGARSGSHIAGYNYWIERVQAKVYLFTHGEILFPHNTLSAALDAAQDDVFAAFKVFWLSPDMTRDLDAFNWQQPETLEHEPMLFELDELLKGSFYANTNTRSIQTWDSTTTFAVNAKTLARFAPFEDFGCQGPDDPYLFSVRQRLGIRNHTLQEPILFHQYHPNSWFGTGEEAVQKANEALRRRFG